MISEQEVKLYYSKCILDIGNLYRKYPATQPLDQQATSVISALSNQVRAFGAVLGLSNEQMQQDLIKEFNKVDKP